MMVYIVSKQFPIDEIVHIVDTPRMAEKRCAKLPDASAPIWYPCDLEFVKTQCGYDEYLKHNTPFHVEPESVEGQG